MKPGDKVKVLVAWAANPPHGPLKEHHLEDYNKLKGITSSVSNCADKIINIDGTNYKLVRI